MMSTIQGLPLTEENYYCEEQLSLRSQNPSEMSGVAQSLQAFLHGSQNRRAITQLQNEPEIQEETHHLMQKRANSTVSGGSGYVELPRPIESYPSERSYSVKPKQVRFNIKEGLKSLIQDAVQRDLFSGGGNDENDQMALNVRVPRKKRASENDSNSESRSVSQTRKSTKAGDSNKTSDSQKPRKKTFKTRQLALKYKRGADEMRRKKFGIEPPAYPQDDTNYSTIVSSNKNPHEDECRETPSFSLAISKSNLHERSISTDDEIPPQPIDCNALQLQVPPSIETDVDMSEAYPPRQVIVEYEKQIGMIVRNPHQRESSRNSDFGQSSHKPGTIVRQRSTSPAQSIQLSNLALRCIENSGQIINQTAKVGSIVRNSSQKVFLKSSIIPQLSFNQHMPTSPDKNNNTSFSVLNINSSRQAESPASQITQLPSIDLSVRRFATLWDMTRSPGDVVQNGKQLQQQLIRVLSSNSASIHLKLNTLRRNLSGIVIGQLQQELFELFELKQRRDQRASDLRKILLSTKKLSYNDHLKSELLRDIVDRLNQKIIVHALRLHSGVKREIVMQFRTYFNDYIARHYLLLSISTLKVYKANQQQDRQTVQNARDLLLRGRVSRILFGWRNLHYMIETRQKKIQDIIEILSLKASQRLIKAWRQASIDLKVDHINSEILAMHFDIKYRQGVFLRWVYARRQASKIKRRALSLVSYNPTALGSSGCFNDDHWFYSKLNHIKKSFKQSIAHLINQKRILQNVSIVPHYQQQQVILTPRENIPIQDVQIDVNLKYQIHAALVQQQNSSKKVRANSDHRETQIKRQQLFYISDGERKPPLRRHSQERHSSETQGIRRLSPGLPISTHHQEMRPLKQKQPLKFQKHIETQLKQKVLLLSVSILQLEQLSVNHHFTASLRANAHDVLNKEDFRGVTDYIQYGIASQDSRQVFGRMFETKAASILFQKWRLEYLKKQRDKTLTLIHTSNLGKQSLVEWQRVLLQKKLKIKEFNRTRQLQSFYGLFRGWAAWNRQEVYLQRKQIDAFKTKAAFGYWLKYLHRQGNHLLKVLRAQNYARQALLSKAMLGLYHHCLKEIRIKGFRRHHKFRTHFKLGWMKQFKKQATLRKVVERHSRRKQVDERLKYQVEFEVKKDALREWKEVVSEKHTQIKDIIAGTHYRQHLVARTFFHLKRLSSIKIGLSKIGRVVLNRYAAPAFQAIKQVSQSLMSSEVDYRRYRQSFAQTRVFIAWKEHTIQMKLVRLYTQKRYLKHWFKHVHHRNKVLPRHYRQRHLKTLFLQTLALGAKSRWNEKRSDIIARQLQRKKGERVTRQVFLSMLEHALIGKRERMVQKTAMDFRVQTLARKGYICLKRRWLRHKKRRLMNQVARDFKYQKVVKDEDRLRESLVSSANDFDVVRLRDLHVFDDQIKMQKYRALTSWKMFVQDRMRRDTVLDRYLLFKRRMLSLRCFLGWRSVARYAQSSCGTTTSRKQPTVRFVEPSPQQLSSLQSSSRAASATFGMRSLASTERGPSTTLFDELETIFQKNRVWLDEQREREEFLKEMAEHYNTRLSHDIVMTGSGYSQQMVSSLGTMSLQKRQQ